MSKSYTRYMNTVELAGVVKWDPIINHQEKDGEQMTRASYVIVTANGFDSNGRELTEYAGVETQGQRAKDVEQYLKKDMPVHVIGRIRRSSSLTRSGEKVWTNKIIVTRQYFEGSCDGNAARGPEADQELPERSAETGAEYAEQDYFK